MAAFTLYILIYCIFIPLQEMEHRHSFRKRQQHRQQGSRTVSRVLDGHNDAGSEHELLPGLGKVDHVQTIGAALPDVGDLT